MSRSCSLCKREEGEDVHCCTSCDLTYGDKGKLPQDLKNEINEKGSITLFGVGVPLSQIRWLKLNYIENSNGYGSSEVLEIAFANGSIGQFDKTQFDICEILQFLNDMNIESDKGFGDKACDKAVRSKYGTEFPPYFSD